MNKKGISLIEVLIVSTLLSLVALSTIDLSANLVVAEANFNNDVISKQERISVTDKITSSLREAAYIYPNNSSLMIPGPSYNISTLTGYNSIAAFVPKFNSDGTIISPSSGFTSFTGIIYSFVSNSYWNEGNNSEEFLLIQTIADFDLQVDTNDPLLITQTPPTNWSSGESYVLAEKLKPVVATNMGYESFWVNENRNIVEFALIPKADGLCFPSSYGYEEEIDDTAYISSISIRNWREPIN